MNDMQCIYINLDAQHERRNFVENNFQHYASPEWRLHRLSAVNAGNLPSAFCRGRLRDGEKACFASHVAALEMSLALPGPTMILEDDACFGPLTAEMVRVALTTAAINTTNVQWDLLFTDVCIVDAHTMVELFTMRRDWERHRRLVLADLRQLRFAGATAYIVNEPAKARLLAVFRAMTSIDVPYDLVLRELIQSGQFMAHVTLPFATSLSRHADVSQIQTEATAATEICWNAFRRLIWADAFLDGEPPTVEIDRQAVAFHDPAAEAFGKVMALRLSKHFRSK